MNIKIKGLHKGFTRKKYGARTILSDLNLEVNSGEFLSIAGPSGCGKTTLIEIIAGLQQPDQGQIVMDDRPMEQNLCNRAIVFQQYGLFPWLTVDKNVEFGLKMSGVSKRQRQEISEKYIQMVHLNGYGSYYPHELSGGMQQRVALARALATEPDLLLLDEPFAALDALTKERCAQDLLRIWKKTGLTIIYVTHDVTEAVLLSDRIVILGPPPQSINQIIEVPLPRPRTMAAKLEDQFRLLEYQARTALGDGISEKTKEEI